MNLIPRHRRTARVRITPAWGITICIGVGLAFLTAAWFLHSEKRLEFVFSHTGVAFIVAGLVGIGYEIWSDRERMQQQVNIIAEINRETASDRFPADVAALFPLGALETADDPRLEEVYASLHEQLVQLVTASRKIATDTQERTLLLGFIGNLLGFASNAAATLAERDPLSAGRPLRLPRSAAHLMAEFLSAHMRALSDGDSYLVISDFATWDGDALQPFLADTLAALDKKRISIRRVFARFASDDQLELESVKAILRRHWDAAAATPRYELAVSPFSYPHLGIFRRGDLPICFKPDEVGDLTEVVFSRADDTRKFLACWSTAVYARVSGSGKGPSTKISSFDAFWSEIDARDPTFWNRFRQPPTKSAIAVTSGGSKGTV